MIRPLYRMGLQRTHGVAGTAFAVLLLHLLLLAQWRPTAPLRPSGTVQPQSFTRLALTQAVPQPAEFAARKAPPAVPDAGAPLPTSALAPAAALAVAQTNPVDAAPGLSTSSTLHRRMLDEGPITLEYQLAEIQNVQVEMGTMRLRLSGQDGRYESQSDWSVGPRTGRRISQGVMDAALLQPDAYQTDAQAGAAAVGVDAAQDPLSVIWNLRDMLANHMQGASNASPEGLQWSTALQDIGTLAHMHWVFAQMDELVLPAGRFRAAQMAATVDGDLQSQMRIWYAPDMDYLPVRIATTYADGRVEDALLALTRE